MRFGFHFLFLPQFFSSLGIGIWLSALSIRYRDLQYVLPFAVQLGLYASPVAYPSSLVPEQYIAFYYLNPMAGMIDGMRWAMFGSPISSGIFYFVCGCCVSVCVRVHLLPKN